jgi:hypothetical protein
MASFGVLEHKSAESEPQSLGALTTQFLRKFFEISLFNLREPHISELSPHFVPPKKKPPRYP